MLRDLECEYGQGYIFSHPVAPIDVEALFFRGSGDGRSAQPSVVPVPRSTKAASAVPAPRVLWTPMSHGVEAEHR